MGQQTVYTEEQVSTMQQDYSEAIKQKDRQIAQQTSAFGRRDDDNLVKWQLELDNIMERIDHLLRGHKLKFNDGNYVWTEPDDDEEKIWFVESLIQISPLTNAEGFPAIGKTARPAFVTSCANEFLFPAMKVFAVLRYAIFAVSESAAVERRVPPPAAA